MNKEKLIMKIRNAEEELAFANPLQAAKLSKKIVRLKIQIFKDA